MLLVYGGETINQNTSTPNKSVLKPVWQTTTNPVGQPVGRPATQTFLSAVSQSDSRSTDESIRHSANPSVSSADGLPLTGLASQHVYHSFNLLPLAAAEPAAGLNFK